MKLKVAQPLPSLSRVKPASRNPFRVALVQMHWQADTEAHFASIDEGVRLAADAGAKIVFLPELTLSRYPADQRPTSTPNLLAEPLNDGPTHSLAARLAKKHDVYVHASLYEYQNFSDGRGLNVAIIVNPDGEIIARTPKLHIPVTAGYYEDEYFQPGPAREEPYPVYEIMLGETAVKLGLPTCWDEWFPEVARNYSLRGAEVLVYPTAIGSEPDHPNFDTEPLWEMVIVANGISNGTFMVVPNRWGNEGSLTFYGSSFISDPYGRILVQAGREGDEVLVADIDVDQRRDWLELFPFLATRRPDTYSALAEPVRNPRDESNTQNGIPGVWS